MTFHGLRRIRPGMLGLVLTLAAPIAAQKPAAGPLDGFLASVTKTTLPNGLTLLVREQPGTGVVAINTCCLLYTSPSPRDRTRSRMPSSA